MDEVEVMDGGTAVEEFVSDVVVDIPKAVPYSIDDLRELTEKLAANINNAPRGTKSFVTAATQYMYHHDFLQPAMTDMTHTLAYMNGDRGTGVSKKRRENTVRNRAKKYFEALSEPAIRKQCTLYGLDYNVFDTVDDRIQALVDKSAEMV